MSAPVKIRSRFSATPFVTYIWQFVWPGKKTAHRQYLFLRWIEFLQLRQLCQEIFKVIVRIQSVGFRGLYQAVDDGTGPGSGYRIDHNPVLTPDRERTDRPFRGLSEHSHKRHYPKELLIRIFSRKALLQAASWEKDAHKIPGQTYNYVIKLKEVA